jgi:hypothetical protein
VLAVCNIRRKWEKPPNELLKVNVDGAFRETNKIGGWGYVICDEWGDMIQSGYGRVANAINPLHMELTACFEGVKASLSIGANNIILESNAQQAVWALQGDDFRLAVVGGVVHKVKDLLEGNFGSITIKYASRECNRVAHELALIGSKSVISAPVVMAGVPNCIMVLVSSDLTDVVE